MFALFVVVPNKRNFDSIFVCFLFSFCVGVVVVVLRNFSLFPRSVKLLNVQLSYD